MGDWFDQVGIWDRSVVKKWRIAARARGETHGVAVLQEANPMAPTSVHHANAVAATVNMAALLRNGLFRVMPGGDSWDNPCMCVVWTNSAELAGDIAEHYGDNAQLIEI